MACFVKNRHSKRIYCKRWSRSKGEIKPKSKKIFCKKERKQINCGLPCPINTMTMKTQHNFRGQVFCNWSNMLEFFEVLIYNDFRWINTWRSRLVWSRAHDWKSCNRHKRFEGSNLSFSAKIKGCPVGHLFIFDSSLYVGEIRTKASIKQSCKLFLAVTEAIRKAHTFIRRNCFEDSKNESLLLRQRIDTQKGCLFCYNERDLHNIVVCGTNATEPSTEADAPAERKLARGRYQANLSFSAVLRRWEAIWEDLHARARKSSPRHHYPTNQPIYPKTKGTQKSAFFNNISIHIMLVYMSQTSN